MSYRERKYSKFVTLRERELLQGMGNCHKACHADFDDTVRMVGSACGLTPKEVKKRTSWKTIDELKIEGDRKGRNCVAISESKNYHFFIRFNSECKIQVFSDESP